MRSVLSVLALALALGGCSGSDVIVNPAQDIVGTWEENFTIAGSGQDIVLALNGNVISGTGNFCEEALTCGSLAVSGTLSGNQVQMSLTFTALSPPMGNPSTLTFIGKLTSPTTLSGTLGTTQIVTYHKV
ncbi:MAG TPA: hypothetical protein VGG76_03195 [Gemmatimonadaceae bacterium]|jgi:hypothetical protein